MKTLLKNAKILTLKNEKLIDGDILIKDDIIVKIAKNIKDKADKVIDCEGNLLMPGFKNAHAHSAMTFLRSYSDDMSLHDWLNKCVFPLEAHLKKNDVYYLSKVAFLEYLTSGITSCFDMYYHLDEIKKASEDIGMRTLILNMPDDNLKSLNAAKEEILLINKEKGLVTMALGFHAEYTQTEHKMKSIAKLAHELKMPVYTHCSETKLEVKGCITRHKLTPPLYLNKLGLFDYGGGIFHGVYLTKKDMAVLAKKNVYVCTCPCSNLKLASGIAPVKDMLNNKIKVAIGTDGPASNNALDMFREMYLVSTLSKYKENDPGSISAFNILKMTVTNGAHMLNLKDTDLLAVNKKADIIMLNLSNPNMQPLNNVINNIVYSGNKLDVKMTMIDGKILYYNHKFFLKEKVEDIYKNAQRVTERLKRLR